MEALSDELPATTEAAQAALDANPEAAAMVEAFRAGKIDLAKMYGLEDDEVESGYQRGRTLLANGLPEQAAKILLGICIMRPTEPRYTRALAFAYHHMNSIQAAFDTFSIVMMLDPKDMVSMLMRAECGLIAKGADEGRMMLEAALAVCGDDPALKPYQQRAQALLRILQSR